MSTYMILTYSSSVEIVTYIFTFENLKKYQKSKVFLYTELSKSPEPCMFVFNRYQFQKSLKKCTIIKPAIMVNRL